MQLHKLSRFGKRYHVNDIPVIVPSVSQTPPATTDPNYVYYKDIFHFDSDLANEVAGGSTLSGTPTYDTGAPKFGSGDLAMPNGSSISFDTPGDLDVLAATDFTMHFWLKLDAYSPATDVFILSSVNSAIVYFLPGELHLSWYGLGEYVVTTSDTGWHHIAYINSAGTLGIYYDGSVIGTFGAIDQTCNSFPFQGTNQQNYIDEFIFVNGVAIWTGASFSVPTYAYNKNATTPYYSP